MAASCPDGTIVWETQAAMIKKAASVCTSIFKGSQPVWLTPSPSGTVVKVGETILIGTIRGNFVPTEEFIKEVGCKRHEVNNGRYALWFD